MDDHVWYSVKDKTVEENIMLWKKIKHAIREVNSKAKIVIVVYPHNPFFIQYHKEAVIRMREMFYKNMGADDKQMIILDCYEHFDISEMDKFVDYCHMNVNEWIPFSKYLNEQFREAIYE